MRSEQSTAAPTSLEAGGKARQFRLGALARHLLSRQSSSAQSQSPHPHPDPSASQPAEVQSKAGQVVLRLACHVSTDSVRGKLKGRETGRRGESHNVGSETTSLRGPSYESCSALELERQVEGAESLECDLIGEVATWATQIGRKTERLLGSAVWCRKDAIVLLYLVCLASPELESGRMSIGSGLEAPKHTTTTGSFIVTTVCIHVHVCIVL